MKLLRSPVLHFILGGFVLFFGEQWFAPVQEAAVRPTIIIRASTIQQLADTLSKRIGGQPTEQELQALIDNEAEEEILYREALRIGLDRDDSSVRFRMIQKMRFISKEESSSNDALYEEAMSLGLDEDDIVIRRILVQKMRLLAKLSVRGETPPEEELQQFLEDNRELYAHPARVSLHHVFLSRDRRPETLGDDAAALLAKLTDEGVAAADGRSHGDPFPLGNQHRARSERQLAKLFGPDFARDAMELDAGGWAGPVESAYGLHIVWITEQEPPRDPPLAEVREQVVRRVLADKGDQKVREMVKNLRAKYEVRVEGRDLPLQDAASPAS